MLKEPYGLPTLVQGLYKVFWIAVEELTLSYHPIMENQMEKNMENEMETGGI